MLAIAALAAGVLMGRLAGGSLRGLARIELRYEWLILGMFVVQAVARGRLVGTRAWAVGLAFWVVASVVLVAALAPSFKTPGAFLIMFGALLNLDIVLLNGAMPVFVGEAIPAAAASSSLAASAGFYSLSVRGTLLAWAGDSLPLVVAREHLFLSPGDVLLVVGVSTMAASAMGNRDFARLAETDASDSDSPEEPRS